jgi:SAM-dependent methyltransferase
MQKRHRDKHQYYNEQTRTTKRYIIPYLKDCLHISSETKVLEIGCGEGGNLKPFLDLGCHSTGVDLSSGKIEKGREYFKDHRNKSKLNLICENIYEWGSTEKFDLIVLRDVIEHIPDQFKFMAILKQYLAENGVVFFGFPPWQNPFGGHQQMCKSKFLSKFPYFHLLPAKLYKWVLQAFNESEGTIKGLLEIKKTGISIERFDKILTQHNYKINKKTIYFISPNYEVKFGIKLRPQNKLIASTPWLRNFLSTAAYYLVSINENKK